MKSFNKKAAPERLAILKDLQALPLRKKIDLSISEFKKLDNDEKILLMFSYGKDSWVIKYLFDEMGQEVSALYVETGIEVDQIKKADFVHHRKTSENIEEIWEERNCFPIFSKMSSPKYKRKHLGIRVSSGLCCYHIKEKPAVKFSREIKADVVVWGNKACDSHRRKFHFVDYGFSVNRKTPTIRGTQFFPLQHWLDEDVYAYLKSKNHTINRTKLELGCKYCATDFTKRNNNLQGLLKRDPDDFKRLMRTGYGAQICQIRELDFSKIEIILEDCPGILAKYR